MAYITRKRIKGSIYYYAEESERRDGKSRRKWQKYLGPLHKIIKAVEGMPSKPKYAEIFQLGGPAAYLNIAEQIKMIQIFDSVLPNPTFAPRKKEQLFLYVTTTATTQLPRLFILCQILSYRQAVNFHSEFL